MRDILCKIREACKFSLIADEATDVSNTEQLCITIRWVDNEFDIHEDPLELIHVPKTDSATLATLIKDSLIRFALPLSQCHGQAYDGASNMSDHISGVAARLQECESKALYVHCLAHCTNLCLQTVARQVEPVRNALNRAMELCQLICFSPKRSSLFEALKSQVSTPTPSLKPLCPTRWTVCTKAIDAILKNYSLLMETLSEINCSGRDDYALKAGGFLNTMETFTAFFSLKLSYLVFSVTEQLSITLQG